MIEADAIVAAIDETLDMNKAAEKLGIGICTLYRWIGSNPALADRIKSLDIKRRKILKRFWKRFDERVDKTNDTGCWLWTGVLDTDGYGMINLGKVLKKTHRVALERKLGRPIAHGMLACHARSCPNRHCINPEHLYEGTPRDNCMDASALHRNGSQLHPESRPRGEKVKTSKLTLPEVMAIRSEIAAGATQRHVAKKFGISKTQVGNIANLKSWDHVQGPSIP